MSGVIRLGAEAHVARSERQSDYTRTRWALPSGSRSRQGRPRASREAAQASRSPRGPRCGEACCLPLPSPAGSTSTQQPEGSSGSPALACCSPSACTGWRRSSPTECRGRRSTSPACLRSRSCRGSSPERSSRSRRAGFLTWVAKFLRTHALALMRYGLLGDGSGLQGIWGMSDSGVMPYSAWRSWARLQDGARCG